MFGNGNLTSSMDTRLPNIKQSCVMKSQLLHLSHCIIDLADSGGDGLPIVLLHGLGESKAVFAGQFEALAAQHRMIAIDLPGHGNSEKPADPETAYSVEGLADTVIDAVAKLGFDRLLVLGHSLGGHVAIEMMQRHADALAGVVITGTPPIDHGTFAALRGYQPRLSLLSAVKSEMSAREADRFAHLCYGELFNDEALADVMRADMRIRPVLNRSLVQGPGPSQKTIVETSPVPLCVINGARDPIIRLKYFDTLRFANLWDGQCHTLDDAGHLAFLSAPHRFNAIVHRFASEVAVKPDTLHELTNARRRA